MQDIFVRKKFEARVPEWLDEIKSPEDALNDQALAYAFAQMHNYKLRSEVYKKKYNLEFPKFEKQVQSTKKEDMHKWDDYIVWKALFDSYKKWEKRYKELVNY